MKRQSDAPVAVAAIQDCGCMYFCVCVPDVCVVLVIFLYNDIFSFKNTGKLNETILKPRAELSKCAELQS